jgi:hypothetical protein
MSHLTVTRLKRIGGYRPLRKHPLRKKGVRRADPSRERAAPRTTGALAEPGAPDRRGFSPDGVGARFWLGGVEIRGATKVILNDPAKPGMKDLNRPAPLPGCRIAPPQHGKN